MKSSKMISGKEIFHSDYETELNTVCLVLSSYEYFSKWRILRERLCMECQVATIDTQ